MGEQDTKKSTATSAGSDNKKKKWMNKKNKRNGNRQEGNKDLTPYSNV